MKSFDEKLKDKSWKFHPNYHLLWLVVSGILLIIAAVVYWFCADIAKDYRTAEFRADVTATLVEIKEGETEKWDYVEGKDEARTPQERATRTYTESIYGYYWEYEIDGKTYTWRTTSSSSSAHQIGDTMDLRFWSNDGVDYHRSYYSSTTDIFMFLSVVAAIAALYLFTRVLIVKIRVANRKKKKRKRQRQS